MEALEIKYFVEAALLAAGRPLSIDQLKELFDGRSAPEKSEIRDAIVALIEEYEPRGISISEVASGFRMQVKAAMADRLQKLWEERPPRYSRALFETLALIAYRQPITRGDIEEIRGVSVSSNIIRQLLERDWVRVVGHRDVPGRPELFGTTRIFLDYFGLKKLEDLPPLADLSDWESLRVQLNLPEVEERYGEGAEGASARDLPVLYPEGANEPMGDDDAAQSIEDEVDESRAAAGEAMETRAEQAAGATEHEAQLPDRETADSDADEDELVVAEWPNPVG
ncbi:MAG TPA: SMC-Scp complex subunit ScpB [Woeseiaceae bacterium]